MILTKLFFFFRISTTLVTFLSKKNKKIKSPTGGSIHSRQSTGGNHSKSPIDDVLSGELFSPSLNNNKVEHDFPNLFGGPAMNTGGLLKLCITTELLQRL